MKTLINQIALFFVLLDNLFLPIDLGVDFRLNYVVMGVYILYYFATHRKIAISSKNLILLIVITVVFIGISVLSAISIVHVLKQSVLISVTLVFSFLLLNSYDFNVEKLFRDYTRFILAAGIVVIVQFIGVKTNLFFLVDYSYLGLDPGRIDLNAVRGRFHAWFYEPSFMAYAFIPVVFVAVARLFGIGNMLSKRNAIFVIFILVMTRSSIGFFGLLLSILIVAFSKYTLYRKPMFIATSITLLIASASFIYTIPAVKLRVDETYQLFSKKDVKPIDIAKTNLSTYALYSNFKITQAAFSEKSTLGSGLGTYEINYDKYLYEVIPPMNWRDNYQINRQDANSLFFRILVELGLLGIFFAMYFIFRNRISFRSNLGVQLHNLWAINNGILVLIILRLLRQGHYTMLGFVLMLLMFYYSKKNYSNFLSAKQ